jgi:hypothetical protein
VWVLELGRGTDEERARRPALLAVAGAEGNDLTGTAILVAWATRLATPPEPDASATAKLLETTTLYLWPRLNPDAAHYFFAKPRWETATTGLPTDDDHDGLVDEDGPEDLDGDGQIAWMRVEDPEGDYILDPVDPRLLLKADRLKGEHGAWHLYSEGRDNDGDKRWNEDAIGGVNLNRNFPYNFKYFAEGSGRHQVSEVETRALADFVVAHPNIGIAFTYGAADNLVQTPKGEAPKRPPTALHEEDVGWYRELGKNWRDALGLKKELAGASEPGTFSDWIYFHRGRLSLAARPWTPALQLELAKSKPAKEKEEAAKPATEEKDAAKPAGKPPAKEGDKTKESDSRNEEERAFLKWADTNAANSFVAWKRFDHPDFAGKKVEIGGWAPFARSNPPESLLGDLADKQGRFLTLLAGKLPRVGVRKMQVKPLGESVYDVTVSVENSGYLPTQLAQGGLTREVLPTRVVLKTENQHILSGTRTVMLQAIQGGQAKEVRWVVHAKGQKWLDLEIISALAGRIQTSVDLNPEGGR